MVLKIRTYTETDDPVNVPNSPLSRIPIPCQPMPRLRTWAGGGVALASRDAALYAPVDCTKFRYFRTQKHSLFGKITNLLRLMSYTSINETRTAAIIPNACPASNVGAPHWRGYGILILFWERKKKKNSRVNDCHSDLILWNEIFVVLFHHGAEEMRFARSVRQLTCVCSGWCL